MSAGRLFGVGVGPGDPDLITLKALRCLEATPVVAYVASDGRPSVARRIASPHVASGKRELNLTLPMDPRPELAQAAYDEGAARIAAELEAGRDVAVLCEGDPLFYGSFIQILARLGQYYRTEVVPGVLSITAATAAARTPLVWRNRTLTVLPATLPREVLAARLAGAEAAAILKVGRHLAKVREVLTELNLQDDAIYVEWASTERERVTALSDYEGEDSPYFALVLVPGRGDA